MSKDEVWINCIKEMKPLTIDDEFGAECVKNGGICDIDVFERNDVLSAVALLRKVIGDEMRYMIEKHGVDKSIAMQRTAYINGLNKTLEFIKECFQIQEQGTAKGMAEIKARGLIPNCEVEGKRSGKSSGDRSGNASEQVEDLSSSQEFPAQHDDGCLDYNTDNECPECICKNKEADK